MQMKWRKTSATATKQYGNCVQLGTSCDKAQVGYGVAFSLRRACFAAATSSLALSPP